MGEFKKNIQVSDFDRIKSGIGENSLLKGKENELRLSKLEKFEVSLWSFFLKKVSGFEKSFAILGIIRFVSLPITFFAVCIAGLLSFLYGDFRADLFLIDALGLILAHSASNVFNDIWDYKNKVDSPDYFRMKYGIHPVQVLGMKKSFFLGIFISFLAFLCGLYLAVERGIFVVILALLGFVLLFSYSGPPLKLKYIGLGEFIVFLVWGPLMIAGSFWVITGKIFPEVILASLPYGITASLILFGKHLDKLEDDREKGVKTLPVILGERRTKFLVAVLVLIVYVFTAIFIFLTKMFWVSLAFLSFPRAFKSLKIIFRISRPRSPDELPEFYPKDFFPMFYVGGAFILNFDFAITYMLGLLFQAIF